MSSVSDPSISNCPSTARRHLELLAPAKNADFGIEAVLHGADAVYIGGPSFGARYGAGNSVQDIARLVQQAHRYHARVFVALNTILQDDETEDARKLIHQLYDAGVDALIVQDMALLEMDLPPIQLHASTQTDIRTPAKAKFLQDVGFSQIVLARELTLEQIRDIAEATHCELEFFVHGALCVAYSGQCFISHAHTGRSANRGECSQACRLPYTLTDSQGRVVAHEKHLLSMKDNDQSANLRALVDAGVRSFKIEGRLKDLGYVKNITAHYRQLLDEILIDRPDLVRASSGRSVLTFEPQPEKTFNRGLTDYFVNDRQHGIEAFDSPSFMGEEVASVIAVGRDYLEVEASVQLNNGDGVSYFDSHKELVGLRINTVQGNRLFPNEMPDDIRKGAVLYRNRDQAFERLLEKPSAERRVAVTMVVDDADQSTLRLTLRDEDGVQASATLNHAGTLANNAERAAQSMREQLTKLGNTWFELAREPNAAKTDEGADAFGTPSFANRTQQPWFLPASALNGLRRDAVAALEAARLLAHQRPARAVPVEPPAVYPESALTYLGNVYNSLAYRFYAKHGVQSIEAAYEANEVRDEASLMITKHCLRYSFNLCPKELKDYDMRGFVKAEPMTLMNGKEKLTLRFDCKKCEMHVVGTLRKSVINATAVPVTFHPRTQRTSA